MGEELEQLYQVTSDKADRDIVFAKASDNYAATCFIMGASEVYFGELKKSLAHSMHVGRDDYPVTLEAAYRLLIRTAEENKRRGNNRRFGTYRRTGASVSFAQGGTRTRASAANTTPQAGRNGIIFDNVTCYTCQRCGHYSDQCLNIDADDNNNDNANEN